MVKYGIRKGYFWLGAIETDPVMCMYAYVVINKVPTGLAKTNITRQCGVHGTYSVHMQESTGSPADCMETAHFPQIPSPTAFDNNRNTRRVKSQDNGPVCSQ